MDKVLFKIDNFLAVKPFIIKLGKMQINIQLKLEILHQNKQKIEMKI